MSLVYKITQGIKLAHTTFSWDGLHSFVKGASTMVGHTPWKHLYGGEYRGKKENRRGGQILNFFWISFECYSEKPKSYENRTIKNS